MSLNPPWLRTPEQISQIARTGFRSAPLMQPSPAPALDMRPLPQAPDVDLAAGLDALSRTLASWKPGQTNGMSISSPTDTMVAYRALPASYTKPGSGTPPDAAARYGVASPEMTQAAYLPDPLSAPPDGISPEEWAMLGVGKPG